MEEYEIVVGLETHVQLNLNSKIFAPEAMSFGLPPNHSTSPVSLALPGTLPVLNRKHVAYAIRLGLALDSRIEPRFHFDRKNYFYADLPKGYQITQDQTPICKGGKLIIFPGEERKEIRIHHVHMEEDAGKSIHDIDPNYSFIDLNRAGAPLLEIVSEPDLRSSDEVHAYIVAVQQLVQYLGISNADMEKGQLRCDCNVSVRKKGVSTLGERCEIKNINSKRFARRAVELEAKRQIEILEAGGKIVNQTLRYDPQNNRIIQIREKETADDYRYFPDPDLPPFEVTAEMIEQQRLALPDLPEIVISRLMDIYAVSQKDAVVISIDRDIAEYLIGLSSIDADRKMLFTLFINKIRPWLQENAVHPQKFPLDIKTLRDFLQLISEGKLSQSRAFQNLFPLLLDAPDKSPVILAEEHNMIQRSESGYLEGLVREAVAKHPDKAKKLAKGNMKLLGLFMGEVMRSSNGRANPAETKKIILEFLKKT